MTINEVIFAWLKSLKTDHPLSFTNIFGMSLRKQDLNKMMDVNNTIHKYSLQLTLREAEEYYLRGGNLDELLIKAKEHKDKKINFSFSNILKGN